MRHIIAAVVGAVVVFIWSSLSWTVLPWHNWDMKTFKNDGAAISQALQTEATESGIYIIPNYDPKTHQSPDLEKAWHEKALKGPFVHLSVNNQGSRWDLKTALGIQFLATFLAAFVVVGLLKTTRLTNPFAGAFYVSFAVLTGSFLCSVASWNWWGFPLTTTWVNIADVAIAWFISGLLMTKIIK